MHAYLLPKEQPFTPLFLYVSSLPGEIIRSSIKPKGKHTIINNIQFNQQNWFMTLQINEIVPINVIYHITSTIVFFFSWSHYIFYKSIILFVLWDMYKIVVNMNILDICEYFCLF